MSDYISREAIAKRLEGMEIVGPLYYGIPIDEALEAIRETPSADVRPVKRGHWITWEEAVRLGDPMLSDCCSVCHSLDWDCTESRSFNFCPNCGADMRKVEANG